MIGADESSQNVCSLNKIAYPKKSYFYIQSRLT